MESAARKWVRGVREMGLGGMAVLFGSVRFIHRGMAAEQLRFCTSCGAPTLDRSMRMYAPERWHGLLEELGDDDRHRCQPCHRRRREA